LALIAIARDAARVATALIACIILASAVQAATSRRTITCPYPEEPDEHLSVVVPAKLGDLPPIEFDYPAKVTRFSFRDGHLLMIAMDQEERARVRVVVSAQLNKAKGTYDGQIVLDLGGHQIMMQQGPVSCTVSP
jgi:hypothetical protein